MIQLSGWMILAGMAAICLGLPIGLYALLTRRQRRSTREIRREAIERGWKYIVGRWQGNPTAFRIDGQGRSGLPWIVTSGNSGSGRDPWTATLAVQFPTLGGEMDFAMMPRGDHGPSLSQLAQGVTPSMEKRLAAFSGAAESAAVFFRDARAMQSGYAAFDAAYEILAMPQKMQKPPFESSLAERALHWPADSVRPYSVLAWRDPFALHFLARLPGPPNWAGVAYAISLAEELSQRVPPPEMPPDPPKSLDRFIAGVLRP
jgi:hypothetical protein